MVDPGSDDDERFPPESAHARVALRRRIDTGAIKLSNLTQLADTVGTDDKEVLDRLGLLGFNADSARVLDVLPLVHVAWADGKIQPKERAEVFAVLESRKIERTSDAWLLVETLLESRPSETFLAQSLELLKILTRSNGKDIKGIVDLCTRVAEASGSLFGFGAKMTSNERALIERIAKALGAAATGKIVDRVSRPPAQK